MSGQEFVAHNESEQIRKRSVIQQALLYFKWRLQALMLEIARCIELVDLPGPVGPLVHVRVASLGRRALGLRGRPALLLRCDLLFILCVLLIVVARRSVLHAGFLLR